MNTLAAQNDLIKSLTLRAKALGLGVIAASPSCGCIYSEITITSGKPFSFERLGDTVVANCQDAQDAESRISSAEDYKIELLELEVGSDEILNHHFSDANNHYQCGVKDRTFEGVNNRRLSQ